MINKDDLIEAVTRRGGSDQYGINARISEKDKARQRARAEIEKRRIEREYEMQNKDYLDD